MLVGFRGADGRLLFPNLARPTVSSTGTLMPAVGRTVIQPSSRQTHDDDVAKEPMSIWQSVRASPTNMEPRAIDLSKSMHPGEAPSNVGGYGFNGLHLSTGVLDTATGNMYDLPDILNGSPSLSNSSANPSISQASSRATVPHFSISMLNGTEPNTYLTSNHAATFESPCNVASPSDFVMSGLHNAALQQKIEKRPNVVASKAAGAPKTKRGPRGKYKPRKPRNLNPLAETPKTRVVGSATRAHPYQAPDFQEEH